MKHALNLLGLVLATSGSPAFAESEADEIRAQIESLRAENASIAARQASIQRALEALESRLGTASSTNTAAAIPSSAAATATPKPRFEVNGDFRLRGQGDYSDSDGKARNSGQIRGRLGAVFAVNERIALGARLVTGDDDDPNSTDVQLSNFDDDFGVALDLAYAQLNLADAKLYGGKIPQPFTRTDLVWDGDVNPQGVSAVYKRALPGGGAFRASSLYFLIDEQAAGPESAMLGGQLGYDSPTDNRWSYQLSAAYYDYRLGSIRGADSGDLRTNLRTPEGTYRSDFNLGDVIINATWVGLGERWPVRLVGDYVKNFGAATDADTGYGLDVAFGRATKPGDWRVTYGHSVAETDSVFAAFSHDNTSIATNYRLHSLTFDYVPFDKTSLSLIWYHYKPYNTVDAGANDPSDWLDRIRLYFLVNL